MAARKTAKPPAVLAPRSLVMGDVIDVICDRIANGESLRGICRDEDMPGRRTVLEWLDADEDGKFRAKYARAREAQADVMDEMIFDEAIACTPESAAASRVKIDAFKWRAAKLAPKRYGETSRTVHAGDADAPIRSEVAVVFVRG